MMHDDMDDLADAAGQYGAEDDPFVIDLEGDGTVSHRDHVPDDPFETELTTEEIGFLIACAKVHVFTSPRFNPLLHR